MISLPFSNEVLRKVKLSADRDPAYPCYAINKVLTHDTLHELNKTERKAAISELEMGIWSITTDLNLAYAKSQIDPMEDGYCSLNAEWVRKAKHLRHCLASLSAEIKMIDKASKPTTLEAKAARRRRHNTARFNEKQLQINHFLELACEILGENVVEDMLDKAEDMAVDTLKTRPSYRFQVFDREVS
jgi:hypothetical protein